MSPVALTVESSPRDGQLTRLRALVFVGALTLALVSVFVLWRMQHVVDQANDIYKFAELGRNIVDGNGFRFDHSGPTIRRAPLYPAVIAVLYLIFGVQPVAIQLLQCFLAAGTCLLVFEIGQRVFSQRVGLLAAVITALHPMVMRYVPDIQVETLLTFLYTLTVYRTVRLIEDDSPINGVWLGVAATGAAMVKAVALPYAALFVVAYLIYRHVTRTPAVGLLVGWKPLAAMAVVMACLILPWSVRNYQVTGGRLVLISGNASGEFLRGYVFAQPRYYLLRDAAYHIGENEANAMQRELFRSQGLVWERDEAETERVQNVAMKAKLRAEPLALVKKVVIASFMFWYVVTSRMNSLVVGGLALVAWLFAIAGIVRSRGRGHHFWLLLLPIFSLNLIYALVLALGRYSAPCIPTLIVLAAFGADSMWRSMTQRG